jgi:hypothetical protein
MELQTVNLMLNIVIIGVTVYMAFIKSYFKEKGKNLATIEDIGEITKIVENVKIHFNIEIEGLKSTLQKQNISYQIQYSFLHQERGKVLVDLYKKLLELHSAMLEWTAELHPIYKDADKEMEERLQRANVTLYDLKNYFEINKIFFTKSFCNPIEELIDICMKKGWDFGFAQKRILEGELPNDYFKIYSDSLKEISKELREKIPPMISNIEDLCRTILNVEE